MENREVENSSSSEHLSPDESQVEERITNYIEVLTSKAIISAILTKLESDLPEELTYHNSEHTKEVLAEAVRYAVIDNLDDREIELLAIAAAYHDAGFLEQRIDNELFGAQMAVSAMKEFGNYTEKEQDLVRQAILDTQLIETPDGPQQVASTKISPYLLDADLSNLGRDDFFEKNEKLRAEISFTEDIVLQKSLELLKSHRWQTAAAQKLRNQKKVRNEGDLRKKIYALRDTQSQLRYYGVTIDHLGFLAKLPLLLTSSLDPQEIIRRCLEEVTRRTFSEAGTVFLSEEGSNELTFWALTGDEAQDLQGLKMPKSAGIVGWVIENNEAIHVPDASTDPRFFQTIDKEGDFRTRDLICAPLIVRGTNTIGALQILNCKSSSGFRREDLIFVEHVARQLALAVDNARLFDNLQRKSKMISNLDKKKNSILSVISHEFKTPLNVISGSAELLENAEELDETMRGELNDALRRGVERLTALMGEVKRLSEVRSSALSVSAQAVDVAPLLEQIKRRYTQENIQRQVELTVKEPLDSLKVSADRALLSVVLHNIIANAIRFTPDGGSVTVEVFERAGLVHFRVRDTGIGIEEKELQTIFETFYEVGDILQHSSGTYEFRSGGLGLGLPTVVSILEGHGSRIEVESVVGEGSTFSFALEKA